MVNKDQLEQTSEGKQVLALMAEHFTDEQFQPALTLIEQRYTEDLTVWDAELNSDSKLPFNRTTPAQRLLIFFASPNRLATIKDELQQREAEHARQVEEAAAQQALMQQVAIRKARAKGKTAAKRSRSAHKVRGRTAAKTAKKKLPKRQRSTPPKRARKQKSRVAKVQKSRAKKNRKVPKRKK